MVPVELLLADKMFPLTVHFKFCSIYYTTVWCSNEFLVLNIAVHSLSFTMSFFTVAGPYLSTCCYFLKECSSKTVWFVFATFLIFTTFFTVFNHS